MAPQPSSHRRPAGRPVCSLLLLCSLVGAAAGCSDEAPGLQEFRSHEHDTGEVDLGPQTPDSGTSDAGQPGEPDEGFPPDLQPDQGFPAEDTGPVVEDTGPLVEDTGPSDLEPVGEDRPVVLVATTVETSIPLEQVPAGTEVQVTCQVMDARGRVMPEVATQVVIHPDVGFTRPEDRPSFIPSRVGEYLIACQAAREGLLDLTPARLEVIPGPVHTVTTEADRDAMRAGEQALATCLAYDEFGNSVEPPELALAVDPRGEGIEVAPQRPEAEGGGFPVTIRRTGFYRLSCPVPGAVQLIPAVLRVEPELPARLAVAVSPALPLYRVGQVVTLLATVTDRYDNPVPGAVVERAAAPPIPQFGFGRFRFEQDGHYTLTATVAGSTQDNVPLSGSVEVEVSTFGPTLTCTEPADGTTVRLAPGAPLELVGQVADPNGVARVLVEGQDAVVGRGGQFRATVPTRFGINFVELIAQDQQGMQTSSFCSFLVADRFESQDAFFQDAVSFRLGQGAVDDGTNDQTLSSLAEILRRMLNSGGLVATVDQLLRAANPLYNKCEINTPFGCALPVRVDYRGGTFALPGPNTLTLQLVNGGLAASVRLANPQVGFKVDTLVDVSGTVGVDYLVVGMIFDLRLDGRNKPSVSLRGGSDSVSVGSLWYDGGWLDEAVASIVLALFDGYFRGLIADQIKSQLQSNIDSILSGIFDNLDITALGQQFNVPGLPGQDPVTIGVGVDFSRIELNPERGLFGFALKLSGPARVAGDVPGAPIPPGAVLLDPGGGRTLGAAVNLGVLNKAIFTLWQAGYLKLDGATIIPGLADAPAGTELTMAVSLPPVARAQDNAREARLAIGLGGARLVLKYPNLFDQPVEILLAAEASAGAQIVGNNELNFTGLTVDRLLFRTTNVNLNPVTRQLVQELLTEIVQKILDDTINGALPVLPIPEFEMPAEVVPYGIPAGTKLGLRRPVLRVTTSHFVVQGDFGQ